MRKKGNKDAGKQKPGTPYSPVLAFTSGVFKITCGDFYLLGTAPAIGVSIAWNRDQLKAGTHPFANLQKGFDLDDHFAAELVMEVPRKTDDSDHDLQQRLLFNLIRILEPLLGSAGCVNDVLPAMGFDRAAAMRKLWDDPAFAAGRRKMLADQAARGLSSATKEKMARAKAGGKNHRARGVLLEDAGIDYPFDCAAEAARYFKVPQQVLDLWLNGKSPWPGTGKRASRYPHLNGLTGRYL